MRAIEIINEKISITHFTEEFENAFIHSIRQTINELATRKKALASFKDEVNGNQGTGASLKPINQALLAEAYTSLVFYLSENLSRVCSDIADHPVSVDIVQMHDRGNANYGHINLSDEYAVKIAKSLLATLEDTAYSSFSETDFFDFYFNHIKDDHVQSVVLGRLSVQEAVSTMVHEMVHVLQRQREVNSRKEKGTNTPDLDYRSYLSDPTKSQTYKIGDKTYKRDELASMNYGRFGPHDDESRFLYLHAGSPQEIASFAHEMALDIIVNSGLDDKYIASADDIEDAKDHQRSIVHYVKNKINPKTPAEEKVFRRYVKLVYQELDRYITHRKDVLRGKYKGKTR